MLMLGMADLVVAQDNGLQQPSARQQQSIDQELARLTKDLELTPEQQHHVRPVLQEHPGDATVRRISSSPPRNWRFQDSRSNFRVTSRWLSDFSHLTFG